MSKSERIKRKKQQNQMKYVLDEVGDMRVVYRALGGAREMIRIWKRRALIIGGLFAASLVGNGFGFWVLAKLSGWL